MRPAWAWIIIDSDKRILLLKRSNYTKAFPHHWTIPGGRWENGENPEEIVVREILEETSLNFTPTKLYNITEQENSGEMTLSHRFLGKWEWEVQIQQEEADGYGWFTYKEANNLPTAFNYWEIVKRLFKEWLIQ